ncbi:MAG: hypothetical protein JW959_09680, partial [Pirellulales bacterium]|nr:hypothetical protein [Pirellulales bacterium]
CACPLHRRGGQSHFRGEPRKSGQSPVNGYRISPDWTMLLDYCFYATPHLRLNMDDCHVITAVTNIMLAVAAIGGAVIAALGLKTWRHELHGRANFELARRVLRGVYEVRNQPRQMRHVFSSEMLDTQYERLNEKATDLDVALLEAEVLWGNTLQGHKESLKDCLVKYRLAFRRHIRSQKEEHKLKGRQCNEMEAILYGADDDTDNYMRAVDKAVRGFEDTLRPYLKRKV